MKLKFKVVGRKSCVGYPVRIYINSNGTRIEMNTGVFLQDARNFDSMSLIHKEEQGYKVKNIKLRHIQSELEMFALTGGTPSNLKGRLDEIINGRKPTEDAIKPFADYVAEFAATKSKASTRQLYEYTVKKVQEYDAGATFETIDPGWLRGFEGYFLAHGMHTNGLAIQLRNIRTVFNWCIDNEYTDKYPFRKFKIKSEKAVINNMTSEQIALLRDYNVEPWQEIYRDLFMLSFYLCGINTVDLLHLRHSDVQNGRLVYRRRKTSHLFSLPVYPEAAALIERHKGKNWLLSPLDNYSDYHDFAHHWNDALKKIGSKEIVPDKAGKLRKIVYHPLFPNITTYTARYSFASIGAELDIPRETIALCLGHSWADVTSHYIAYDTKKIDKAVRRIIDYVNNMVNHSGTPDCVK